MSATDTQDPYSTTLSKKDLFRLERNMLGYTLLPSVTLQYYQHRQANQLGIDSMMLDKESMVMPV